MSRAVFEVLAFGAASVALHLGAVALVGGAGGGGDPVAGDGGTQGVTLQGGDAQLAALVREWERPPQVEARIDPPPQPAPSPASADTAPLTDAPPVPGLPRLTAPGVGGAPDAPVAPPRIDAAVPDLILPAPRLPVELPAVAAPARSGPDAGVTGAALVSAASPDGVRAPGDLMPLPPARRSMALPAHDPVPPQLAPPAPLIDRSPRPPQRPARPAAQAQARPSPPAAQPATPPAAGRAPTPDPQPDASRAAPRGAAEGSATQLAAWGSAIRSAVLRAQRAPRGSRATGTVTLRLSVTASGGLAGLVVQGSSGVAALDAAATDAVRRARLPRAPDGIGGTHHFSLPVSFR